MLRKRLLSAAIVITCTLTFIALDIWANNFGCPGLWLLPLGLYLMLGSAFECALMLRRSDHEVVVPTMIGACVVMSAACVPLLYPICGTSYPAECPMGPLGLPLAAVPLIQLGCFAWQFSRFSPGSGAFQRAVLAGWVGTYFGIGFAFALALRMIKPEGWGLFLMVGTIVVTKCSDAGAYFSGRFLGRTKLCPSVSPNKTVEGLLGGIVVACVVAWLYFTLAGGQIFAGQLVIRPLGIVLFGVVLTIAGLIGDLLESMFKRETGVKDSGNLLPGLGGLWDVTDSLLPAFVCSYLLLQSGLIPAPAP